MGPVPVQVLHCTRSAGAISSVIRSRWPCFVIAQLTVTMSSARRGGYTRAMEPAPVRPLRGPLLLRWCVTTDDR